MALRPTQGDNMPKTELSEEAARIKQYKNVARHEDMRRRRNESSVEIRKQKGADLMMKRRNQLVDDDEEGELSDLDLKATPGAPAVTTRLTNEDIIKILSNNPTLEQMRQCFEALRRSLSRSKNPPVDEVIKSGLVNALVEALKVEDDKVRFEAAWALTNVVSGTSEQTVAAVEAGATLPLIELTQSPNPGLAEQALWAVANIAGDSAQLRDYVIQCSGVEALMALVDRLDALDVSCARTLAWAFSNMCRHKNPHAPLPVLERLSKGLAKLIAHPDKQVRQDACWAVSYLTDGPDEQITLAKTSGVLPHVLKFLSDSDAMVAPALRVLGNMSTGNDELTQCVVDLNTLDEIIPLSERSKSTTVVKECCWLISNIIAGTNSQIQAVIDAGIMPFIIEVLRSGDFKCQFEASWAVANLAQGGTAAQILTLLQDNAIPALCSALKQSNIDLLNNALETLYALLNTVATCCPERLDEVREAVEENEGLDHLERLQESESDKVYASAYRIISDFFSDPDNDEDQKAGGEENQPVQYSF
ncbi:importin subunit alpha-2 family protein [Ancylostoma caninum]|uniref:Importin subunit alpha n=1 Tax=Ancylostoma caninum TaxID=29170 RepID=A0A368H2N0_ANCCA|nr:importin subunit alpha-2 family protein [Ancylostoma caninum]